MFSSNELTRIILCSHFYKKEERKRTQNILQKLASNKKKCVLLFYFFVLIYTFSIYLRFFLFCDVYILQPQPRPESCQYSLWDQWGKRIIYGQYIPWWARLRPSSKCKMWNDGDGQGTWGWHYRASKKISLMWILWEIEFERSGCWWWTWNLNLIFLVLATESLGRWHWAQQNPS